MFRMQSDRDENPGLGHAALAAFVVDQIVRGTTRAHPRRTEIPRSSSLAVSPRHPREGEGWSSSYDFCRQNSSERFFPAYRRDCISARQGFTMSFTERA
jgi:hypothetical protein